MESRSYHLINVFGKRFIGFNDYLMPLAGKALFNPDHDQDDSKDHRMKQYHLMVVSLFLAAFHAAPLASQDAGAIASGNWSNSSIWTTNTVPGASNNVFIGSSFPAGSINTATVTLTQNHSANNVYLGYGAGINGTLDLGDFVLTANSLNIGNGGTGSVTRGTGIFQVSGLSLLNSNSLTTSANDVITGWISLGSNSSLTLPTAQTLTGQVTVASGSVLTTGGTLTATGIDNTDHNLLLNNQGF